MQKNLISRFKKAILSQDYTFEELALDIFQFQYQHNIVYQQYANTLNISIVLISTFIIYNILCKLFNKKSDDDNDKKNIESKFNFEYLLVSGIISICISLIISYIMAGRDESILTDNYWDPVREGPSVSSEQSLSLPSSPKM